MSTYANSGVNIEEGDNASRIAYNFAKETFVGRKGLIGEPVVQDGGFAGLLDMGDFYLVQNDDGVGSKSVIADAVGKYDTLGTDLLAMVIDDAACVGAEVITCSNTMDVKKVNKDRIRSLMEGFKNACVKHKVVIPGGEIAELNSMVNNNLWNATSVGVVKKHKVITGKKVKAGDKVVALRSDGFRSNGFSLVRYILEKEFGENAYLTPYNEGGSEMILRLVENSWGAKVLTPSKIYYSLIMKAHGRFDEESVIDIKGITHITGGGIPGNITRILDNGLGVFLDNLWEPREMMLKLQKMGNVPDDEAYRVWNMGTGMCVILDEKDTEKFIEMAKEMDIEAKVAGEINDSGVVRLKSLGAENAGQILEFEVN